jgi:Bacterial regulatory proteins, gntR family
VGNYAADPDLRGFCGARTRSSTRFPGHQEHPGNANGAARRAGPDRGASFSAAACYHRHARHLDEQQPGHRTAAPCQRPGEALTTDPADAGQHPEHSLPPTRASLQQRGTNCAQVAESIRAHIADGALAPGQPAPSGAALARATGYSALTCRKALSTPIKDGALVSGTSPNARPASPARHPPRADACRRVDSQRYVSMGTPARPRQFSRLLTRMRTELRPDN